MKEELENKEFDSDQQENLKEVSQFIPDTS